MNRNREWNCYNFFLCMVITERQRITRANEQIRTCTRMRTPTHPTAYTMLHIASNGGTKYLLFITSQSSLSDGILQDDQRKTKHESSEILR